MASEYLFLRLDEKEASWLALDSQGRRLTSTQRGPLAEARTAAEGRRLVVLVPARDVIATLADVPVKSPARLRQVLPYSLEETLAEDVDELSFATGSRVPSGEIEVAVVAHQRMQAWLSELSAAGLAASEIYSEADGVPETPNGLTLVFEGQRIYGRMAGRPPFVFEGMELGQLLGLLRANAQEENAARLEHLRVYADQASYERLEGELGALRAELASVDVRLLDDGPLGHLAASLIARPGVNLLQGDYAPRSDWSAVLKPWRFAASLVAVLVLLGLLGLATEYFMLRHRDRVLTDLVASACQQRIGAARMSTCRSEIDQRLAAAGAAPDAQDQFLSTLVAIAASRDASSRVTALSYRQGVLDMRVVAPSVPALDEFVRRMSESSFTVSIQSASPTNEGVEGQLQIVGKRS